MWPAASSAKRRRCAHYAIGLVLISGAFDAAAVEPPAGAKAADVLAVASYLGAKNDANEQLDPKVVADVVKTGVTSTNAFVRTRATFDAIRQSALGGHLDDAERAWRGIGGVSVAFARRTNDVGGAAEGHWETLRALADDGSLMIDAWFDLAPEEKVEIAIPFVARRKTSVQVAASLTAPFELFVDGVALTRASHDGPLGVDGNQVAVAVDSGTHMLRVVATRGDISLAARFRIVGSVELPPEPESRALLAADPALGLLVDTFTVATLADVATRLAVEPLASAADCEAASVVLEDARNMAADQIPNPLDGIDRRAIAIAERMPNDVDRRRVRIRSSIRLAERLYANDDTTGAIETLREVIAISPSSNAARAALARIFEREDRTDEATQLWQTLRPQNAAGATRTGLEALRFLRGQARSKSRDDALIFQIADATGALDALLLAAEISEQRGDVARARAYLGSVAKAQPAHAAWLHALRTQAAAEGTPSSIDAFLAVGRQRLALRPTAHRLAEDLALTLQGAGRPENAHSLLVERTSRFGKKSIAWRSLAVLEQWRGNVDATKVALLRARELRPQDPQLRRMWRAVVRSDELVLDREPTDVHALMDRPQATGAAEAGAEILLSRLGARFFENGLGHFEREEVIRIVDAERAKGEEVRTYPYAEGREELEVLRAELHRKNGDVVGPLEINEEDNSRDGGVYSDERTLRIAFEPLRDGDVIWVVVREDLVGQQNLFGDFFGAVEPVSTVVPVHRHVAIIDAPLSRPIAFGGRGTPEPRVEVAGERQISTFERVDIPRLRVESHAPPYWDRGEYLSVSTYADWSALGEWYARLIEPQLVPSQDIVETARDVVRGATSPDESVQRIYEWVITNTRYVGIELGIHGWKPYPVTSIYRRKFGDCKDKASLLVAMLRAVGIGAQIVLVRTADLGSLDASPPTMWAFNHAIAYVPALDLYLDGTAEHAGMNELPALDQGATVLRVTPLQNRALLADVPFVTLASVPLATAAENANRSNYVLQLDRFGLVTFKGEEQFWGQGASRRRVFLAEPQRRQEVLEAELAGALPGAEVTRVTAVDIGLSSSPVKYQYEGLLPQYGRQVVGGIRLPLSLYPQGIAKNYAGQANRTQSVWIFAPWTTTNRVRVVLPIQANAWSLPTSVEVDSKHLYFRQEVTRTSDGFVVEETTTLKSREIPLADFPAFRDAALEADAAMARELLIEFERDRT